MNDRITLTMQDILEKEFKIDARGYRPQEVDKFLDIIIKDYNEYNNIIRNLEKEKRALALENQNLKNEARNLRSSIEAARIGRKRNNKCWFIKKNISVREDNFRKIRTIIYLGKCCI